MFSIFLIFLYEDGAFIQTIAPMRKESLVSIYYHRITSKLYKQICTCTCLHNIIFAFPMVRHVIHMPPCFVLQYIIFLLIYYYMAKLVYIYTRHRNHEAPDCLSF